MRWKEEEEGYGKNWGQGKARMEGAGIGEVESG